MISGEIDPLHHCFTEMSSYFEVYSRTTAIITDLFLFLVQCANTYHKTLKVDQIMRLYGLIYNPFSIQLLYAVST